MIDSGKMYFSQTAFIILEDLFLTKQRKYFFTVILNDTPIGHCIAVELSFLLEKSIILPLQIVISSTFGRRNIII